MLLPVIAVRKFLLKGFFLILKNLYSEGTSIQLDLQLLRIDMTFLRHKALLVTLFHKNTEMTSLALRFYRAMGALRVETN